MQDAKPTRTPLPMGHVLYEARSELTEKDAAVMENVPYQSVLGCLLFLSTRTRPDIATAVSMLGKFASAPTINHWQAMKHVVRYLICTRTYGIHFKKNSTKPNIEAWSDADWGRDLDNRRSRSGVLITVNKFPISWSSRLQKSVALSTAEAEFSALSDCIREVVWLRRFFKEVHIQQSGPTQILQDNLGAISWTQEVQGLRKVKHVGIRYNYVKEAVQTMQVEVKHIPSSENRADSLTKALVGSSFVQHREYLNVVQDPSRGGVLE